MKRTITFDTRVECDMLAKGVIAIHKPLGGRGGLMLTYVPTMQTIWTFDPPHAQKRATAWRRRLESCNDAPNGEKFRALVEELRKEEK